MRQATVSHNHDFTHSAGEHDTTAARTRANMNESAGISGLYKIKLRATLLQLYKASMSTPSHHYEVMTASDLHCA